MSPMNQRSRGSLPKSWRHSYCFSSSREKMTTRLGSTSSSRWRMNALPNEPVPPVTRMDEPLRTLTANSRVVDDVSVPQVLG